MYYLRRPISHHFMLPILIACRDTDGLPFAATRRPCNIYSIYRLILTFAFVHLQIRNNCNLGRSPFIIIHFTCKLLRIIALNSSIILISSYNTLIASSPQQRNQQNERQNSNYFFPNLVQLRKLLGLVDPLKTAKKEAAAAGLHCPRPKFRQKFPIL